MTGLELRSVRLALGMTQLALANALGLTRQYVGMLERDEKAISKCISIAAYSLRPAVSDTVTTDSNPNFRKIELALIANGLKFERDYQSDDSTFDFFLPELQLAITLSESGETRNISRNVRGVITLTGQPAIESLEIALAGRPLRASVPKRTLIPMPIFAAN